MIIQTGMRTDIPAYYAEWFMNRIKAGFVLVRNPYNPGSVTKYKLTPDVVDLFAFCTKNPIPMLSHIKELHCFGQYWFVTITPYGKDLEPNVPDKETVMNAFRALSKQVGTDNIGWRYDPVIVDQKHTVEWHIQQFRYMAEKLYGYTHTCIISFIDLYEKVKRNFPEVREVAWDEKMVLGKAFINIAKEYDMVIKPCAEGNALAEFGADCSGCMTLATYEKALHYPLDVPLRKLNQRNGQCACILGTDIGAYDTCGHLCRYCYANTDPDRVKENMKKHDPASPFLIGGSEENDVIHEAEQSSWKERRIRLF